jgi:hypothetical protein
MLDSHCLASFLVLLKLALAITRIHPVLMATKAGVVMEEVVKHLTGIWGAKVNVTLEIEVASKWSPQLVFQGEACGSITWGNA